jgi:hypothetical protein
MSVGLSVQVEGQVEEVEHLGVHHRELGPELMRARAVPVDLHVVVVAVGLRKPPDKQVVLQPVVRARVVGQGIGLGQQPADAVDAVFGDHRPREELAAGARLRVARRRVVDAEVRVEREHLAEVTAAHPLGGHREGVEAAAAFGVALPRPEVEQLVADDRAADGTAHDRRARVELLGVEVPGSRVPLVLLSEEERRAAQVVGARLGRHRHRRAAGHALRRVEAVGRDVDVLDRLGRRDVAGVVGQPDVDGRRAVDAGGVGVARRAVDVGRERAPRRVGLRVLELRRRRARHQVHEGLVVPVLVERHVDDVLGPQVDADVGLVGLEERRLGGHRHRLGEGAHLEPPVDAHDAARRHRDARLHVLLEALQGRAERVRAGEHVADRVGAGLVADGLEREPRALVLDGHGGAGNGRARLVGNLAGEAAIDGLRRGRARQATQQGYEGTRQQLAQ